MTPSPSSPDTDAAPASIPSADAEAAPDQERCANCDAELTGAYCTVCGQRAGNRVVPLWQVTNEFLEDLFAYGIILAAAIVFLVVVTVALG